MVEIINKKIAALDEVIEGHKKQIEEAEKKKAMWEELKADVANEVVNNSESDNCDKVVEDSEGEHIVRGICYAAID